MIMGWLQVTLVLIYSVVMTFADCPMKCDCEETNHVMECKELDQIPPAQDGYTDYIFTACSFSQLTADSFSGYQDAKILRIFSSQVSKIAEGAFSELSQLEHLDLGENDLSSLNKEAFTGLNKLKDLHLEGNRFTSFDVDVFSNMPMLEKLYLDENIHLELTENTLKSAPELTTLSVSNCGLFVWPPAEVFKKVPKLVSLTLNQNQIKVLPSGGLSMLPQLRTLELDSCGIERVEEGAFNNLHNLDVLNLGFNQLTVLSDAMLAPVKKSLTVIKVEHNKLLTLSENALNWPSIKMFRIGNNPWQCDCRIAWMLNLDLKHDDEVNVTCSTPDNLHGLNLRNLTREMLADDPCKSGSNAVALGIGIPILIICLLLIGYYVYKIIQNRRRRQLPKKIRYEAVYKDTVESGAPKQQPLSEL